MSLSSIPDLRSSGSQFHGQRKGTNGSAEAVRPYLDFHTSPALTIVPGGSSAPGPTNAWAAIQQPSPTTIGRVIRSKVSLEKSCDPVHRNARCEMHTLDPITILPLKFLQHLMLEQSPRFLLVGSTKDAGLKDACRAYVAYQGPAKTGEAIDRCSIDPFPHTLNPRAFINVDGVAIWVRQWSVVKIHGFAIWKTVHAVTAAFQQFKASMLHVADLSLVPAHINKRPKLNVIPFEIEDRHLSAFRKHLCFLRTPICPVQFQSITKGWRRGREKFRPLPIKHRCFGRFQALSLIHI